MAMPRDREAAEPDLALLVAGKPKGGRGMMPSSPGGELEEMGSDPMAAEEEPLPPGFESAAAEAFPDMDPMAYPALKRLIASCMDSY